MPKLLTIRTPAQAYQHAWYLKNRPRLKKQQAKWQKKNKKRIKEKAREWRARNPDKLQEQQLRFYHNMTIGEYVALLQAQGGVCAICLKPPDGQRLCVDHCHKTHAVRGLLHRRCNILVGQLDKHPGPLALVFAYVRRGGHLARKKVKAKSRAHLKRKNWTSRKTF